VTFLKILALWLLVGWTLALGLDLLVFRHSKERS